MLALFASQHLSLSEYGMLKVLQNGFLPFPHLLDKEGENAVSHDAIITEFLVFVFWARARTKHFFKGLAQDSGPSVPKNSVEFYRLSLKKHFSERVFISALPGI
jgi:hypothetical protein